MLWCVVACICVVCEKGSQTKVKAADVTRAGFFWQCNLIDHTETNPQLSTTITLNCHRFDDATQGTMLDEFVASLPYLKLPCLCVLVREQLPSCGLFEREGLKFLDFLEAW